MTRNSTGQDRTLSGMSCLRLLRRLGLWAGAVALLLFAVHTLRQPGMVLAAPPAHVDRPTSVAVACMPNTPNPDKHEAVTGGDTMKVFHWKVPDDPNPAINPNPPTKIDRYKKSHLKKVSYVAVSLQGTGLHPNKLFQASYDGDVAVSDLRNFTNAALFTLYKGHYPAGTIDDDDKPEVWVVAPSFNGSRALSATNVGEIKLWDTGTGITLGTVAASGEPVGGLAFLPPAAGADETQFLAAHGDGKMILYDIVSSGGTVALNPTTRTFSHDNPFPVNSVAVTSDGRTAVSASFDMTLRIWDLTNPPPNPVPTAIVEDHEDMVWRVAISPNDQKIASASEDGTVRLFNMQGRPFKNAAGMIAFKEEPGGVMGVAFVTDNKIVYTTGSVADPEVRVWDITGLQP